MSGVDPRGRARSLFARRGDRIVDAPAEDQQVLAGYDDFEDKGPVVGGYRLTILTRTLTLDRGAPARIIHVVESVSEDAPLFVMGPKPVCGEYVDGTLATETAPEHPFEPASYDGRVLPGPGVDSNYEITEYRFDEPGQHHVQWRLGVNESNLLAFEVR